MRVSLIITTYNRHDALDVVLQSVSRQTRRPDETIVVDDGSDLRTAMVVDLWRRRLDQFSHVWQPNRGFRAARLRNLGIAAASGDYVALVDGDMALHAEFLADHLSFSEPGVYLQGVRIPLGVRATRRRLQGQRLTMPWHVNPMGKSKYLLRHAGLARLLNRRTSAGVSRVHSCNQSFWRSDLLRVNGFDERFVDCGGEDIDLCRRMALIGIRQRRLRYVAKAYHLHHPPQANWSEFLSLEHESARTDHGIEQHAEQEYVVPFPTRPAAPTIAIRKAA
ncbi:MAG: glycosyltransferase [Planctomycetota bacterium]